MEIPVTIPHVQDILVADLSPGGTDGVIILPGWGGARYGPQRILVRAARALAEQGYTTLRLDFRGRGDSSGDTSKVTLDDMIGDAVAAANWLRAEHGIDHISLVGLCSGGNVAIGAASQLHNVDHVVCWSLLPFMEHKINVTRRQENRWALLRRMLRKALHPESIRKFLRGEANVHGAMRVLAQNKEGDEEERRRKTSSRNILADFTAFSGRLHLLYGSRDPEADSSQAFFTDWCHRNRIPVDARVIAGAPHNFYTAHWTDEVVAQTARWIPAINRVCKE